MNKIQLTEEQLLIINATGNIVVIAVPGSGKTTTITHKINKILSEIKYYQGVIAISYTNKASDELKNRVEELSQNESNSFFGTIYKFYLTEIIIPFAKYLFEYYGVVEVVSSKDFDCIDFKEINNEEKIRYLKEYFLSGKIVLEEIPYFANYIFDNSKSCKLYLKSRYSHIFIDEYQDCDELQHEMFKKIVELGIRGIAVGDPDQSIFKYNGSSPKYLLELSDMSTFESYGLSVNHRSHSSIINYAYKFLFPQKKYEIVSDKRVYKWKIIGDEETMANRIDTFIPRLISKYNINHNKEIAILCRNNSTAKLIFKNLKTPAVYFCDSPIDKSSKNYEIFFRNLLIYMFGSQKIYPENILENYIMLISRKRYQSFVNKIISMKTKYLETENLPLDEMLKLTTTIFGEDIDLTNIQNTINNDDYLMTYKPMELNKIHIMTIHKSKGLEFDAVFVVDLHKFIIPKYDYNKKEYIDINEDKCIHYVSLTRARKTVILTVNSLRHNLSGEEKTGIESEFIDDTIRNDLIQYRNK